MESRFDDNRTNEENVYFTRDYDDVPLSFARKEAPVPEKIRRMQALYHTTDQRPNARGYYFYVQGKFMEDYTDDYSGRVQMTRYFPTYHSMSPEQLRAYFTWRTKWREKEASLLQSGSITPWTAEEVRAQRFLIGLYLDELINNIGCTPQEGYLKLSLLKKMTEADALLCSRIARDMEDYRVYYDIPAKESGEMDLPTAVHILESFENYLSGKEEHFSYSEQDIYTAMVTGSGYSFRKPAEKELPLLSHVCAQSYGQVSAFYVAHGMRPLTEQFFGRRAQRPVTLFEGEVFFDHLARREYTYQKNPDETVQCRDGVWTKTSHPWTDHTSSAFRAFCREIDRQYRDLFHTRAPLKGQAADASMVSIIGQVMTAALEEQKQAAWKAAHPEVKIDFSRLSGIRSDAEHTFEQLNIEEETEEPAPAPAPAPVEQKEETPVQETPAPAPEPSSAPASSVLNDLQTAFLQDFLSGGDPASFAREHHQMLSVLVDGINEALYEEIGDTVLEMDGNDVSLVEDYRPDVEALL